MVSHNSSFLSSLAREGGSNLACHQYFLVLGPAQRGVPLHHVDLPLDPPLHVSRTGHTSLQHIM